MFFPLMMAEFGNQTVLDFGIVQERALKYNARRTGRKAASLSHHEWCFYCFCFHHLRSSLLAWIVQELQKVESFIFLVIEHPQLAVLSRIQHQMPSRLQR